MLGARALVFPSIWYEGQPMVLIEALAAGLALVVADIGGVPETVAGTTAAVLAHPGNRESWEIALSGLTDDTLVDRSGTAARRVFDDRYTAEIGLEGLINHYTEAIAQRQGRAG
jgi:glycosyltransferase involved in cell wall biosynthesis